MTVLVVREVFIMESIKRGPVVRIGKLIPKRYKPKKRIRIGKLVAVRKDDGGKS